MACTPTTRAPPINSNARINGARLRLSPFNGGEIFAEKGRRTAVDGFFLLCAPPHYRYLPQPHFRQPNLEGMATALA